MRGTFKNNFTAILMRSLGTTRLFTVGIADNHALAIFPCADSTMTFWVVLRDSMTFLDSSERTFPAMKH